MRLDRPSPHSRRHRNRVTRGSANGDCHRSGVAALTGSWFATGVSEFAAFDPGARGQAVDALEVRGLTRRDVAACARLAVERAGGTTTSHVAAFTHLLDDEHSLVLVAEHEGDVVGYGRATWLTPSTGGGRGAPDGWYLTGVVVQPRWRRRSIGRQLTTARLDLCGRITDTVWYFASVRNQASINMHRELGFTFVTDDFVIPGVTFTGGKGGLFQRSATDHVHGTSDS